MALKGCCVTVVGGTWGSFGDGIIDMGGEGGPPPGYLPMIAVYESGAMIDSCVKDDATPENVEAMIKKYI